MQAYPRLGFNLPSLPGTEFELKQSAPWSIARNINSTDYYPNASRLAYIAWSKEARIAMAGLGDPIRVLHVDDESEFTDVTRTYLERDNERFEVLAATSADEGLSVLEQRPIDCIVSDYDMPAEDGLAFLEAVRAEHPDLPFILFTGKGSEEIASEAISAGVSDYLEKTGHTDQYTVLANRITNLVEKYEAEQARRRNRVLVEEASDAILIVSSDATIEYATPSAESVLGRTPDELRGTNGFDPVHPADRAAVQAEFAELVEHVGARRSIEFRYERPDGSWIWVEGRGRNLLDAEAVDGIAVYTRDITARRERVTQLEEEKALNQAAVDSVADFYWGIDLEGYVTRWSDEDGSVTGYTHDDAVGRHTSTFHPDEHVSRIQDVIDEIHETGTASVEADLLRKDGERVPFHFTGTTLRDDDGSVRSIVGLGQDISERKRRQRELERYEAIVENSEDGIYVFDSEGNFEFVNQRIVEVSGIPQDAWIGEHVSIHTDLQTLTESEVSEIEDAVAAVASGDQDEARIELKPDIPHELRILELRLTRMETEDGPRVIGFSRDITERREYEQTVEERNDRLEEFVSTVSHDLRNPLNVAQGRLALALDDPAEEHLTAAADAVDRSLALIDDLLKLARDGLDATELEPLELADTIDQCWRTVETSGATLKIQTERRILADRSRLKQLLENLIRNSVEHGGEGVTITVGDLEDGFYVADDGPGIPPERREQVFDIGHSSDSENTGFGLTIVEQIAEAHGWVVEATESETGGARFDIRNVQTV